MAMDNEKRRAILEKQKERARKRDEEARKKANAEAEASHKKRMSEVEKLDKKIEELQKKQEEGIELTDKELEKLDKLRQSRYKIERKDQDEQYKEYEKGYKDRKKWIDEEFDQTSGLYSFATTASKAYLTAEKNGREDLRDINKELIDGAKEMNQSQMDIGISTFKVTDYQDDIIKQTNEITALKSKAASMAEGPEKEAILRQIEAGEYRLEGLQTLQAEGKLLEERHKYQTAYADSVKNMQAPLEEAKEKLMTMAATLEGIAMNPMVLLIAGAAMLAKHFVATEQAAEDFRKSMGLSISESKQLETNAMNVAKNMATAGVNFEEALGATEALVKEFGDMGAASEKNLETVLRMNKALGMTNDEAAKFLKTMTNVLGTTTEQAEALAAGATNMARMAGVAPQAVIQDMSANADDFAAYIKDGGKNLAEAAVFAAKMGTSVSTLVKMADSLLDIESSIEAEMEAQVLTGKNINLEKARQLAYDGKIEDMAAEISKQVGTAAEWEAMRPEARKAMAKAMGMEVSEMGNMISKQETLQKLADGTLSTQEALAELPLSEVMDAKGLTSGITDIKNSIQAIALNLMEVFRPVFSFIAMILKPIAKVLGWMAHLINNPLGKGLMFLYLGWKLINSEFYAHNVAVMRHWIMEKSRFAWDKMKSAWKFAKQYEWSALRDKFTLKNFKQQAKNFVAWMKNLGKKIIAEKKFQKLKEDGQKKELKGMEGIKGKFKGMKDKFMGGKGGGTGVDASPKTPAMKGAGAKGEGASGFANSIGKIDMGKVLKGAAALLVVAAAMFVFAKALKEFPLEPGPYIAAAFGLGILAGAVWLMGQMSGEIIKGSIAMLIMAAAFLPFAFGLSLITDLNFGNVIAMAGALLILTAAMVGLGALMMSGIGAVAFFLGAAALAVLGASLIIFGLGLQAIGSGMEKIIGSIGLLSENFMTLTESIDYQQLMVAAGAIAIFAVGLMPLMLIAPLAAWGIGLLGGAFMILGAGLLMVSGAAMIVNIALQGVAQSIQDLIAVSDGFGTLALNLFSLAGGFASLAGSLLLLTPFVPLLMLLGASGVIGQILGVTEVAPVESVEGGGGEAKKDKASPELVALENLNMKFDMLIEAVKEGGDVNLDGKKVGDVLGGGLLGPVVG